MAKKKTKPAEKAQPEEPLAERIETAMREAISSLPGIETVSERAYCEAVAEACEMIKVGAEMRLEELDPDESEG